MLSEKLFKAVNDQVNAEMYSAYMYLSMSAYAEDKALKGVASWMFNQSKEEMAHAMHMYQYLLDRGNAPVLNAIEQPPHDFTSCRDLYEKVLAHEQMVSGLINKIATIALNEGDHACYQFIMWYVNEQVEEEANVNDILGRLALIGDDKGQLLNLDNELGARVYTNPFPNDIKAVL